MCFGTNGFNMSGKLSRFEFHGLRFYLKEHRDFNWLLGAAQAAKAESTFDSRRDSEAKKTLCVFSRLVIRQTCSIGLRSGE